MKLFILQNKSVVDLHLTPGIQLIQGENGVGKTTLFDSLLGYENAFSSENYLALKQFKSFVKSNEICAMERECILFESLKDFTQQITGPAFHISFDECLEVIQKKLLRYCDLETCIVFENSLRDLEKKYGLRVRHSLSMGEGVMV